MNEVVAPENLQLWAYAFARRLAGCSAPAMTAIKGILYEAMEMPFAGALSLKRPALPDISGFADYAEGLAALYPSRAPQFSRAVQ